MNLRKPLPIQIENGPEKISGFIMKFTLLGLMVELDNITFKVGSYVTGIIPLSEKTTIIERLRSIKHYDKFYRKAPPKKPKEGEPVPEPKMLCELHFDNLTESNRMSVMKFLMLQQQIQAKAPRSKKKED